MSSDPIGKRRLRFNLRSMLACMALLALAIGWYTSITRERSRRAELVNQLMNARLQVQLAESRSEFQRDALESGGSVHKGVLSKARLDRMNLRGADIRAGNSAFQLSVFDNSDLRDTSISGGISSFQGASFKNANLTNAKLTGGGASFQLATFENADLSNAVLTGNLKGVSLKNAKCMGAKIQGSFQGANIASTQFQNADISAITEQDLASCYFDIPPTYDATTKFPEGFDPAINGWTIAPAASKSD